MPTKIALFISSLQKGGSERVMVNLAEYFLESGYQVTLVTQRKAEDEYPISEGIMRVFSEITEEETTANRLTNFVRRFQKLREVWKTEQPDLILSFIGKNNVMALLTSRFLSIPVVVSVRGEPREEYYSRALRFAAKSVFRFADGIVMQTEESRQFFPASMQDKIIIQKNSLNPTFIRPRYEGLRDKTIVAVGRVDSNKNHELLIRSFAELAEEFPEYRLLIYGNGERREALQKLAEELCLQNRIELPGSVSQVADTIEKAEIFVLTSDSEGMPNTLIEAMSLGLACISTDCPSGGPQELIVSGENGILVPIRDKSALTTSLRNLMESPETREYLGKNAAKIQKEFSPEKINASWKSYLEELIKNE